MVTYKTPAEIKSMREAGRVVGRTLERLAAAAEPGVTLRELDALAVRSLKEHDATSSFLHYRPESASTPFPATVCLSVNDEVVHGIPSNRRLKDGDLLSIDFGAVVGGYHGDAAVTVQVGRSDAAATRLMDVTRDALTAAIAQAVPGNKLGDVSHAVESTARAAGYGILEGCGGHGIGTAMHEDPAVPNTGRPGRGLRLREGLVIAIEPMLHEGGSDEARILPDDWTIATADGSRAAHFEHTVAITADGPEILTVAD